MARQLIASFLVLFTLSCATPPNASKVDQPMDAALDSVTRNRTNEHASDYRMLPGEPSVLAFDTGDTLRTGLNELKDLARLTDPLGRKWFLFSGRPTGSQKDGISLYVLSPGDSTSTQAAPKPWHMPGQLTDTAVGTGYYQAQVFAGEVLPDTIGVIWYEQAQMPDGKWRHNTTVLDLNGARPDTLVFFGHGRKSSTMGLAFQGKCKLLDSLDQRLGR